MVQEGSNPEPLDFESNLSPWLTLTAGEVFAFLLMLYCLCKNTYLRTSDVRYSVDSNKLVFPKVEHNG